MFVGTQIPVDLLPAARAYLLSKWIAGIGAGCAPLLWIYPLPPLYESGVVFRHEPEHGTGREDFALPWIGYARGWVDCDDAAIWRIAELLSQDKPATCRADYEEGELHVYVRHGTKKTDPLEDPARILLAKEGGRWAPQF